MGMEGINWGEVNSQAKAIFDYLSTFKSDVTKNFQDFVDELCYYWASGNAKIFGDYIQRDMNDFNGDVNKMEEEISTLIQHAAEIYSRSFNVDNQVTVSLDLTETKGDAISNPFQESVNGVTGMNKTAVDECYEKFKANVESSIETAKNGLESIELSIFDVANAQKVAFSDKLNILFSRVNNLLLIELQTINNYREEEKDRIDLAKQQTVSTFNA
jgi:hypothetical protein